MKIIKISFLSFLLFAVISCYEDKGNYDYDPIIDIKVENETKSYSLLGGIEPLVINQKIISATEGEISEDNPNMEFSYSINVKDEEEDKRWTVISRGSININKLIDYPAGAYTIWFQMKDKRNGYTFSKTYKLTISSSTYEGWMILGTNPDNSTRLDMLSVITPTRTEQSFDLMKSRGLPENTKGAHCFGFYPNNLSSTMDRMYIFTDNGGYLLEKEGFGTSDKSTINFVDFILPTKLTDPVATWVYCGDNLIVTTAGDAFAQKLGTSGARFQDPINTTVPMKKPEFKVAPFIGYNAVRPYISSYLAVFYDITNKRFMGLYRNKEVRALAPLNNPANPKFDFNIGMNLVYMVGTAYDNGVTFALLKDANNVLNLAMLSINNAAIEQHSYYENITGTEMQNAKYFAFHSKFPIMFYAVGNKVYSYNWSNRQSKLEITLGANEEITMIKFQLYSNTANLSKYSDPVFKDQQYNLIVASYNGAENGGKIGFYKTNDDHSVNKVQEFTGLCKIKDVMYRERR